MINSKPRPKGCEVAVGSWSYNIFALLCENRVVKTDCLPAKYIFSTVVMFPDPKAERMLMFLTVLFCLVTFLLACLPFLQKKYYSWQERVFEKGSRSFHLLKKGFRG